MASFDDIAQRVLDRIASDPDPFAALSDDTPFETWQEAGQTSSATRANKRWKAALAEYQPPPIDPGVDEALRDFIDCKKAAMSDQWY